MNSIKKFFVVISVALAVMLMCTAVWAASSGTCGNGVNYVLSDSGVLTITGNGKINGSSFKDNTNVKQIVISGDITGIGSYAFENCTNCTSVKIVNNTDLKIDSRAFDYHKNLKSVTINNSGNLDIGSSAFCSSNDSPYCPNIDISCTGSLAIGNSAFMTYGKNNKATIKLHSPNIVSIDKNAFFNYGTLSALTFESLPMQFKVGFFYSLNDYSTVTVTVPTNSTLFIPKGYAQFKDESIQKNYINEVVNNGCSLSTFLNEGHEDLVEGTDYTLTTEDKNETLTSSNAYMVFDNDTTVKFQSYSNYWTNHTVSFIANGHGTAPASQTVLTGSKVIIPIDPTASGYKFMGWYTEASCINEYNFNTSVTSNLTLYAKWLPYYTVTFNASGHGTTPESQTVLSGDTIVEPEESAQEHCTFLGWYKEQSCVNKFDFTTGITGNMTLYAKWKVDTPISSVDISGLRDFYKGESPYTAVTLSVLPESGCEIFDIDWCEYENGFIRERIDEEYTVSTGEQYKCVITINAKDGYYFTDDTIVKIDDKNLYFDETDGQRIIVYSPVITVSDSETSGVDGNCEWTFSYVTNTLTISGTGEMPDYTETDKPSWEYFKDSIEKVVINEGITKVGNYAFYEYTTLERVSLPDSLIEVGESAFYGSGLTSVVIPKNVSSVYPLAFSNCEQLEKAYITGKGFVIINEKAFYFSPLEYIVITNAYFSAEINKSALGYMGGNKIDGFTIYAPIGSDDRGYAESNNFRFIALGNVDLNVNEEDKDIVDIADAALLLKYISGTATLDDPKQLIAAKVTDPTKDKPDMCDVIALLDS